MAPVKRENPNNMRYEKSQPTIQPATYLQSYIDTPLLAQNSNTVVKQNYSSPGCRITDMYNKDQISYNQYRIKPVDMKSIVQLHIH